jgi:predicted PurR-regulated permease PerM
MVGAPARRLLSTLTKRNGMRERPGSADVTHITLAVLCIAVLAAATFQVISPFLTAILWAGIISITAWPLVLRLDAALGRGRGLTVTIITLAILLVMFVPLVLAIGTIVDNAQNIGEQIRLIQSLELPPAPAWLERVPLVGARAATEWRSFIALDDAQRANVITPYLQGALRWMAAEAGSIGAMLLQFLLTTIITAIMLANGETIRNGTESFAARLAGQQGVDAAVLAAGAVRGVVLGVVGTALIQTLIGGGALMLTGVPAAALLAAVMLFLCLAQLGPVLVVAPAIIWLYWSGRSGAGTVLLVLGFIAATIDNVIRPVLIRRGANLPLVLIFAGVIGGLIAFGIIGLFIGPVVLAVTHTLLKAWVQAPEREVAEGVSGFSR